jgi:hypothetical protein
MVPHYPMDILRALADELNKMSHPSFIIEARWDRTNSKLISPIKLLDSVYVKVTKPKGILVRDQYFPRIVHYKLHLVDDKILVFRRIKNQLSSKRYSEHGTVDLNDPNAISQIIFRLEN